MTDVEKIKDAIGDLKSVHKMYDVMCGDWSFCWTAIEALEKQIPQKPIIEQKESVRWYCLNCGKAVYSYYDFDWVFPRPTYCHHCGQALSWEGIDND